MASIQSLMRKERDSNPRYPHGYASLAGTCFRPLSHLSMRTNLIRNVAIRQIKEYPNCSFGFLQGVRLKF
jgi:hypothetical protein